MPHDHQVAVKLVFPHFRQIVVVDMEVNDGRNTVLQVRFCNAIAALVPADTTSAQWPALFFSPPSLTCTLVAAFLNSAILLMDRTMSDTNSVLPDLIARRITCRMYSSHGWSILTSGMPSALAAPTTSS